MPDRPKPNHLDLAMLAKLVITVREREWTFDPTDLADQDAFTLCGLRLVRAGLLRQDGRRVRVTRLGIREAHAWARANPEEFRRDH